VNEPIYLDNHATTRCDPRVFDAMRPWFTEWYGNAGSRTHAFGWRSSEAVETARAEVARAIGGAPEEIVFTGSATEATNLAIFGVAEDRPASGDRFVTQATEHAAVLEPLRELAQRGREVQVLPVDGDGRVDPERIASALAPATRLVAVMAANNEIGTVQPVAEIGALCRDRGVPLLVDGVQALGRIPVDVRAWNADFVAFSGHKAYGPKGTGALWVRRGAKLVPRTFGGGQERGLRSGTLNVPGIVGLGRAFALASAERQSEAARIGALRDRLLARLRAQIEGLHVNGSMESRLAGNLNVSFEGVDGEALLLGLRGIAVSTGSACASARPEPSRILRAIGVPPKLCIATLRFGIGRFNTEAEIDAAAAEVTAHVASLREHRQRAAARRTRR
jgi:cysteine desulfurase